MSVQSLHGLGLEPAMPPARAQRTASTGNPTGTPAPATGATEPRDEVVVSEQARALAGAGEGKAARKAAPENVELKLDFRELRKLASAEQEG